MPFEVPESWEWVKLGNLCDYGKNEKASPSEINENAWILDLEDIEKDTGKLLKRVHKNEKETKSVRNKFKKGDVLYSKLRTYLNKVLVADVEGYCTTEILPLDFNGFVVPKFARHVLMSSYFLEYTAECCYGVKMPRLGTHDGENALFPLPPIEEQKRIVRIADSVIEVIDEIEDSSLSLVQYIAQTKSKVLDLAIRGKLVPQDSSDEPASVLLERIRKELKLSKTTSDKFPYPFEVPSGWIWANGFTCFNPMENKKPVGDYFNYIDIEAIDNEKHVIKESRKLKVSEAPSRASRLINKGDTLFSMVRPYLENIAYVDRKHDKCIASTGFYVCKPNKLLYPRYLYFLMLSNYVINGLNSFMKGDNSPSINNTNITTFLYPIPPLSEQLRIVEKIEEIFKMLDKMQVNLQANT